MPTFASLKLVEEVKERHGGEAGGGRGIGSLQSGHRRAVVRVKENQPLHQQEARYVVSSSSAHWHSRVALYHYLQREREGGSDISTGN